MPILIMIFFALIGTTVFGQCGGNTSFVINPSFEGPLAPHVTPTSWDICMPGYTPDTQPGSWDISLAPTNGGSYLGLVHCGYWQEGAGQTISSPMLANETYHFTIDLATTSSTGGGINPGCVELQVWGGWSGLNGGCDQSQLLWSSGDVWDYQHINNWVTHDIVFTPNANYDHILFLINGLGCSACPYIMIDNMSPIVPATNFCDFSHTEVCLGSPTQFTDLSSSANSTIASWLWNFGGGVTSTQQNPSYTFPTSGYHSVTLTIVTNEPCTLTVTKNIFVKEAPNATASIFSYPTCGQNNGSVVANGGVSYVWNTNPPQYSNYATTIPAGNYTVTVTGVNNCTAIANVALTQTQGLTYTSNVQQPTCSQPLSGAITLSITSGNPPFTYSWDMGSTSNMLTDLCVGSYTCTLSDNAGCSSVFSTMILPPQAVNTSIAAYTNCTCYNTDNGTASVSVTGGTAPFYYLWSSGSLPLNTQNINGLPSGNHSVTVSDANGCSSVSTVTITKPDTIKATFQVTDALCGFSNGSILANVTGGTPGYSFTWYSSPAQTGNPAQNLSSGNYNVQVRDANNCISNFTTTVNSTGVVNLSAAQTQHVSCYGYNDGSANITFNGGTFPYTINCSSGFNQTTSLLNTNISNLSSGNYTITVSDANNCQSSSSFTINQPQPISIIGITQNDHCNQLIGAINISASGGSGNYNYLWNYNGLISEDIFNIPSGIYSVTATDNNTCTGSAVFNILNIEGPSASLSGTDILCYGGNDGSIYATVSEGTSPLTFLWNTGNDQSSINNLTAGTYSISITDSAGCSTFESLTINQPTQVSLSVSSITNASGYGASDGSAIVAGQGGTPPYQFNWSNNQTGTTVTNLAAGTYIVTLTDHNG